MNWLVTSFLGSYDIACRRVVARNEVNAAAVQAICQWANATFIKNIEIKSYFKLIINLLHFYT